MTEQPFIIEAFMRLISGLPITLSLTAGSVTLGLVLSLCLAAMHRSGILVLKWTASLYVLLFRGTPLLLQLFLIYYGLGQFRPFLQEYGLWTFFREAYWCGMAALTLNLAAYLSEIVRGGLIAVPRGQVEAAYACGMSRFQVLRRIIMPIAIRQTLPAYGNEIILMVKGTSLVSTITLMDVTGLAAKMASETYRPIEVFICAGAIYLSINLLITRVVQTIDWRLTPHLRAAPDTELASEARGN